MSSALKEGKTKEEVTPEALLERLKNVTTPDDIKEFFKDLWFLVMDTIKKADADAGTKIWAILFMGLLGDRFYELLDAYKVALEHDYFYKYNLRNELEEVLKKLIEVYAYLKNGGLLWKAADAIAWASISAEDRVEEFSRNLARSSDDLNSGLNIRKFKRPI